MASSSSVSVFDNHRFKTAFNEELYNTIVKNKKVIAECCVDLDNDEYPEVREQIALRRWRRLTTPKQEISIDLIHEFYANAIITEEEMEEHGGHTYRSFVRGVPIDFSPENIRTVMRSETPVIRAILIHCIMGAEDVRAEDIIAYKMVHMAQGIKEKGKLGFPSTIYKLCKEAGVPLPRPIQHRQQDDEDEDHPMPQAEEGNEEGNEERQGYEHDYHHQPEFDHQPEYEHHQDFQEEPLVQQPPLYHVPTYTDQHDKDLHSIETQLQNMMWYQQQTLENISKSQAKYMAELREIKGKQQELYENNDRFYHQVRKEQREMAKEIQQVKNYQVNQTMVDSTRNKAILDELAAVKSRQEEFFSNHANQYNMIRQEQKLLGKEILDLRDWTRNASGRECYTVWAHQQANPNLVEMSSQKIVKNIYDNIDHKRPMFQGILKSDLQPSDSAPPPSSSNDPKNPPK
ncbi:hypothetical protein PIB30_079237 [Stylosanthes scabra]|uniref:Uncharacterized protein n=1 Tax=Stylosanthes scabra TaxID=79078 RepID=A0ABU6WQR8_9FABA|nr:hypothetical protein [Stylosanthes scabra]